MVSGPLTNPQLYQPKLLAGAPPTSGLQIANFSRYYTPAEQAFALSITDNVIDYWEPDRNRGANIIASVGSAYAGLATDDYDAIAGQKFVSTTNPVALTIDNHLALTVQGSAGAALVATTNPFLIGSSFTVGYVVDIPNPFPAGTTVVGGSGVQVSGGYRWALRCASNGQAQFDNRLSGGDLLPLSGVFAAGQRTLVWSALSYNQDGTLTAAIGKRNPTPGATATWANGINAGATGETIGAAPALALPFIGNVLCRFVIPAYAPALNEAPTIFNAIAARHGVP